jgi:beta-lactamase superfamily II metal-dependent hydrolase
MKNRTNKTLKLIIDYSDEEHIGGMDAIIKTYEIGKVYFYKKYKL